MASDGPAAEGIHEVKQRHFDASLGRRATATNCLAMLSHLAPLSGISCSSCTQRSGWLVHIDVPRLPAFDWQGSAHDADDARLRAWAAFIREHCKRVPIWAQLPGKKEPPWTRWDRLAIVGTITLLSAGGWALNQLFR